MDKRLGSLRNIGTWLFGVSLPLAAVLFDPAVFRGIGFISEWAPAGYTVILVGIGATTYWLYSSKASPALAGILAICSLCSLFIGVLLLPLSFAGIFLFGIGLLGLIPFGTAFALYRCSKEAWQRSQNTKYQWVKFGLAAAIVSILVLVSQVGAPRLVLKAHDAFINPETRELGSSKLLFYVAEPLGLRKKLVLSWQQHKDPAVAKDIAAAYEATFGASIEIDEVIFFD